MNEKSDPECIAFVSHEKVAEGSRCEVAIALKRYLDQYPEASPFIFDSDSSAVVELDLRGSVEDVEKRYGDAPAVDRPGPGRPKLGVVAREISLLPRHWEWLALQPGGASVTLRKLVEEARKLNAPSDRKRHSQNITYKFMSAVAGNLPHFEEANRAFFAGKKSLFETLIASWPKDIKEHALKIGASALDVP